jgi:hypothetical protein
MYDRPLAAGLLDEIVAAELAIVELEDEIDEDEADLVHRLYPASWGAVDEDERS